MLYEINFFHLFPCFLADLLSGVFQGANVVLILRTVMPEARVNVRSVL